MARGPRGQYRPADPIANAITIGRIATGDTDEREVAARVAAQRRPVAGTRPSKSLEDGK